MCVGARKVHKQSYQTSVKASYAFLRFNNRYISKSCYMKYAVTNWRIIPSRTKKSSSSGCNTNVDI